MFANAANWVRAHRWEMIPAVLLALMWIAIGWRGLHPAPPRIEYRDRVVTKTQVVDHQVVKTVTVAAKTEQRQRVTHRHVVISPDGWQTIDVDTGTQIQAHVDVRELGALELDHHETSSTQRDSYSVQTPAVRPRWRVSALAGIDLVHVHLVNGFANVRIGAHVERRLVGPIWLGAWTVPQSALAGVSIGVEW